MCLCDAAGARYRFARDCVRFDPSIAKAVQQVLGSTVICDTLDDANTLRFDRDVAVKCVSLDGSVIAKNGNMTGGVGGDIEKRAARWDNKRVTELERRRDDLVQESEQLKR